MHFFRLAAEVSQFQNRLNHSMMDCQDKAKDQMVPGMEADAKQMEKLEATLLKCMTQTVDSHIGLLKPMRQRVDAQLTQLGAAAASAAGSVAGDKKKGWW